MDLHDDDDGELTLDLPGPQEGSVVEDQAEELFKQNYREAQEMQREKELRKENEKTASGDLSKEKTKEMESQLVDKFAEFASRQEAHWGATTSKDRNFLHYLAYESPSGVAYYPQALIKVASTRQPHLMGALDSSGRTPLAVAIAEKNYYFCYNAVLRLNETEAKSLGEQLRSECRIGSGSPNVDGEKTTCLHAALSATFYKSRKINAEKFITKIISLVPKEMFIETDSSGRTPLHLAVLYEKCLPSQERIVLKLLKEGPAALNCKIKGAGGSSLSIFQFHEESKTIWEKKLRLQMAAKNQKNLPPAQLERGQIRRADDMVPGKEEKQAKPSIDMWKTESKKVVESTARKGEMLPPSWSTLKDKPERMNRPDANVAVRRNSITSASTPLAERRAGGSSQTGASPVIKAQDSAAVPAKVAERQLEDQLEGLRETASAVSELLKLFCLRNNEPDIACRFLRSPYRLGKQDKALWFDFGPPRRLSMKEFTRSSFQYLEFESILQYVAFPQIQLVTKQSNSQEQFPMVAMFNWLRAEGRGVERIIRVIVDDLEPPSHTDVAIEQSLAGFKVEVLDWRRKDLCPASLAKFGDHLREISLYWSGSNPVLRAWSEPDGLAQLPSLETINIVPFNVTEAEERINQNLEDFEKRLYKSWLLRESKGKPKVVIHPQIRGLSGDLSQLGDMQKVLPGFTSSHDKTVDSHRWIECMKRFSNEFRQIKELGEVQDEVDSRPGPVVVALIDDGTDIHHSDLDLQKKFDGESFYKYKDRSGARVAPWWHSESGHGTLMARLIAGICPSAIIHVIKLHTFCAGGSTKLQIDPNSAVEAIAHAVKLGAHIISMSWTIMPPEELMKKKQFTDDIASAIFNSRDTLMFCAASDQGKYPDRTYPHAVKSNIFRIGAADAAGRISDKVGDPQSLSFILPGQDVVIDNWYNDVEDKTLAEFEAHTGSSVATALAAGLAALIIECVRLGVIHTNNSHQQDPTLAITVRDLEQIRDHETMRTAMYSIGTDNNTNHLYLKVWELFDARKLKAAKGRSNGELEFISGLARHFLRKGIT